MKRKNTLDLIVAYFVDIEVQLKLVLCAQLLFVILIVGEKKLTFAPSRHLTLLAPVLKFLVEHVAGLTATVIIYAKRLPPFITTRFKCTECMEVEK